MLEISTFMHMKEISPEKKKEYDDSNKVTKYGNGHLVKEANNCKLSTSGNIEVRLLGYGRQVTTIWRG